MYAPSGTMQTQGNVVGMDTWGRSTMGRMFFDVEATKLNETAAEDHLLAIDAREGVEIQIREGSDRSTDTYEAITRSHELAWDIEFGPVPEVAKPPANKRLVKA